MDIYEARMVGFKEQVEEIAKELDIKIVSEYKYLGAIVNEEGTCEKAIQVCRNGIMKAFKGWQRCLTQASLRARVNIFIAEGVSRLTFLPIFLGPNYKEELLIDNFKKVLRDGLRLFLGLGEFFPIEWAEKHILGTDSSRIIRFVKHLASKVHAKWNSVGDTRLLNT